MATQNRELPQNRKEAELPEHQLQSQKGFAGNKEPQPAKPQPEQSRRDQKAPIEEPEENQMNYEVDTDEDLKH